jgi:hypothetical protein
MVGAIDLNRPRADSVNRPYLIYFGACEPTIFFLWWRRVACEF